MDRLRNNQVLPTNSCEDFDDDYFIESQSAISKKTVSVVKNTSNCEICDVGHTKAS